MLYSGLSLDSVVPLLHNTHNYIYIPFAGAATPFPVEKGPVPAHVVLASIASQLGWNFLTLHLEHVAFVMFLLDYYLLSE